MHLAGSPRGARGHRHTGAQVDAFAVSISVYRAAAALFVFAEGGSMVGMREVTITAPFHSLTERIFFVIGQ